MAEEKVKESYEQKMARRTGACEAWKCKHSCKEFAYHGSITGGDKVCSCGHTQNVHAEEKTDGD